MVSIRGSVHVVFGPLVKSIDGNGADSEILRLGRIIIVGVLAHGLCDWGAVEQSLSVCVCVLS